MFDAQSKGMTRGLGFPSSSLPVTLMTILTRVIPPFCCTSCSNIFALLFYIYIFWYYIYIYYIVCIYTHLMSTRLLSPLRMCTNTWAFSFIVYAYMTQPSRYIFMSCISCVAPDFIIISSLDNLTGKFCHRCHFRFASAHVIHPDLLPGVLSLTKKITLESGLLSFVDHRLCPLGPLFSWFLCKTCKIQLFLCS